MPRTLTLEYSYDKNVYDTFLQLEKFGELHPNMTRVVELGKPEPHITGYEIFEDVTLFGFIKMKPRYKAKVVEVEKGKHIQYLSHVQDGIFLAINFYFTENAGKYIVREEIEITGNPIIAMVLMGIIKKAHTQIHESLKK